MTTEREPGCTLDRDKARNALIWMQQNGGLDMYGWDDCLDRLAACVRPAAIDRDALIEAVPSAILDSGGEAVYGAVDWGRVADRILALVQPAGVTLTPEEAALALRWKRDAVRHGYVIDIPDDDLTARLEATQ